MATIEPRLIHLLNEATTPQLSHSDIPPSNSFPYPSSTTSGPLPPLESENLSHRFGRPATGPESSSQYREDDHFTYQRSYDGSRDGGYRQQEAVSAHSLQALLSDVGSGYDSHQNHALVESMEGPDASTKKKRARAIPVKEDFVQLPQPLKKQKAAQQSIVMPPIINGLHEPPPHAALFPPIASSSFDDSDSHQTRLLQEMTRADDEASHHTSPGADSDRASLRPRKRAAKPRRKWTEEETTQLLLGVSRHGVGKWTSILEDPHFQFNSRTAGDLKDRFRTCCPEELRMGGKHSQSDQESPTSQPTRRPKGKTEPHFENILIDQTEPQAAQSPSEQDSFSSRSKKSRAHRKNMEDLAELGIHGPFKKSRRRERRPFTEKDDREILEGLDQYGPAWTKIQRDPRFHLSCRQPTDLRDRVRNKYPQIYSRIEKGIFQTKDFTRFKEPLEPSVHMSVSYPLEKNRNLATGTRVASSDNLQRWIAAEGAPVEYSEGTSTHTLGGEMDISRLLLDDPTPTLR